MQAFHYQFSLSPSSLCHIHQESKCGIKCGKSVRRAEIIVTSALRSNTTGFSSLRVVLSRYRHRRRLDNIRSLNFLPHTTHCFCWFPFFGFVVLAEKIHSLWKSFASVLASHRGGDERHVEWWASKRRRVSFSFFFWLFWYANESKSWLCCGMRWGLRWAWKRVWNVTTMRRRWASWGATRRKKKWKSSHTQKKKANLWIKERVTSDESDKEEGKGEKKGQGDGNRVYSTQKSAEPAGDEWKVWKNVGKRRKTKRQELSPAIHSFIVIVRARGVLSASLRYRTGCWRWFFIASCAPSVQNTQQREKTCEWINIIRLTTPSTITLHTFFVYISQLFLFCCCCCRFSSRMWKIGRRKEIVFTTNVADFFASEEMKKKV